MNHQSLLVLLIASSAACAFAEPRVVHVPNNQDQSFLLGNLDTELPNVRIRLDQYATPDFGSGAAPLILDNSVICSHIQPTTYETEAADLHVINGTPYPTPSGMLIEDAIGSWVFTRPKCNFDTQLPVVISNSDFCGCPNTSAIQMPLGQSLGYIPFRVRVIGAEDWSYGWVAFKTESGTYTCESDCGDIEQHTGSFAYIAVGFETEPNTPIIAGGGLCPGDINYDAQRDIFDVFDYLALYAAMDPAADLTGEGSFDIFDVFAFLDDYETPCEF